MPVAVGGDSAGGTVAALAALIHRDVAGPVPPQLLAYPPLDPSCARASYTAEPGALPSATGLRAAWKSWLGAAVPDSGLPPTPLQASSLAGLAPVALVVGADDPVRDDVTAYAERLRSDGVAVTRTVIAGAGHAELLRSGSAVLTTLAAALSGPTFAASERRDLAPNPHELIREPNHWEGTPS
jgi:acetyl esterase